MDTESAVGDTESGVARASLDCVSGFGGRLKR